MKKVAIFLAAGSAMAIATPAMAQSVDVVDGTFNGPRVEALVGYDVSKAGSDVDDETRDMNDESIDGVMYGFGAGYDIDLGSVVIGPEAEFTWSSAKTEFDAGDAENFGLGNVSSDRDLYLGARVGAKMGDRALVYAKGGYTNAKYNLRLPLAVGGGELERDIDTDGFRLGAGVEYAFSQNAFAKLEYRYSNYSSAEIDFEGDRVDTEDFDIDVDRHQVVAGVGLRF